MHEVPAADLVKCIKDGETEAVAWSQPMAG
jgi:hypothetical protein